METKVQDLVDKYLTVFTHRDPRLFTDFLVTGYRKTTLSCVDQHLREEVMYAKVCLGMLITLYDDLADNPGFFSPVLLKDLYRLGLDEIYYPKELNPTHDLALHLFREMRETLRRFPRYMDYKPILSFDVKHIFLANQYSELMTAYPSIRNLSEGRSFGPYNMGMVAAGMIDLMASSRIETKELGKIREVLIQGQRIGRIGNVITTYEREKNEGDLTNEMLMHPQGISIAKDELITELNLRLQSIKSETFKLNSINVLDYVKSLICLFELHQNMEGII